MSESAKVISPSGVPGTIPADQLAEALSQGYKTPEQAANEEKYASGVLNPLKAFGAAALRAPSLGTSDHLLESLGADREGLAKRAEYNPEADTAGTLIGLGAGAFAPGLDELAGAGMAGKAASVVGAPMKATEALGAGAGAITKKLLGGIPGSKTIAGAADTAAQTAIYNAAQKIDETHLAGGDLQQGVENALASTGDALALGAGLHVGTVVAGKTLLYGAQKSIDALGTLLREKVVPKAAETAADTFASVSSKVGGEPIENFAKYTGPEGAAGRQELLDIKQPLSKREEAVARDAFEKKAAPTLQEVVDAGREFAYKQFGGILQEAKGSMLKHVDPLLAIDMATKFSDKLNATAKTLEANDVEFSKLMGQRARTESDLFERKLLELQEQPKVAANDVYDLLNKTRQRLDEAAKWDAKMSLSEHNGAKLVRETTGGLRSALEDTSIWGEWGSHQKAINGPVADFLALTGKGGAFRKEFLTDTKYGSGHSQMRVKGTSITNMVNKIDTQRGQGQLRAIQELTKSVQGMIDEYRASAAHVGDDLGHEKHIQSLLETAGKIEETHANIAQGQQQFGDSARMRALANSPFVTGVDQSAAKAGDWGGLVGAVTKPVGKVLGAIKNPLGSLKVIARIERFNDTTARRIQSGINAFFKSAGGAGGKVFEAARPVIAYEDDKVISYQKFLAKKATENGDSQLTAAKYHAALQEVEDMPSVRSPVAEHAPMFTKGVGDKQAQIHQGLWEMFPKDESQLLGIAGGKFSLYQPSKSDMADYLEKEQIAKRPVPTIAGKIEKGTLTEDNMKILDKFWPKIAQQFRDQATKKLGEIKHDLTGKQKQQLAVLLGHPVDEWQDGATGQLVQKNFADQLQKKAASMPPPGKGGIEHLAKDTKTASQSLIK